jgi:AP-1 complex subunit sigma 1/2
MVQIAAMVIKRNSRLTSILEWRSTFKLLTKRYTSLYFVMCIDGSDNELMAFEIMH